MIYPKLKLSFLLLLIVMSVFLSPASRTLSANQLNYSVVKNFETSAKIGDYVEYKLGGWDALAIDQNGTQIPNSPYFSLSITGFFRWTVIGITGNNITLKIEIDVTNFYSAVKDLSIINGIAYDNSNETLGYNPFWIPTNFNSENVTLGGNINNPEFGRINNPNYQIFFLGGVRDVFEFVNTNNYVNPSFIYSNPDTGNFYLYFSKFNGIAVELDDTSQIWTSLQFKYNFLFCSFLFSSSNIDFGPIDYPLTLLYFLVPYWLPIFVISGIVIIILSIKINKWIRGRHV